MQLHSSLVMKALFKLLWSKIYNNKNLMIKLKNPFTMSHNIIL
jgi:hypothetical protein